MGICYNKKGTSQSSPLKPNAPVPDNCPKEKHCTIQEPHVNNIQQNKSSNFLPGPALDKKPTSKQSALNNEKEVEMTIYKLKKFLFDKTQLVVQYKDKEFLPQIESLLPKDIHSPLFQKIASKCLQDCDQIKWLRCNEIYGLHNYRLFMKNEFNPEDIIQGSIASSYFVASIVAIASKNPVKFKNIFELCEVKEKGIFALKFFIQGVPKIVVIDDLIPCKLKDKIYIPAFSRSCDKEICVMLLEKAWAKLNMNCYMKTWIGTPQEALHALCEAPCTYELHKFFIKERKKDILWMRLKEAEKNKWFMTTITEHLSEIENTLLLPECQAFAILGIYEVTVTIEYEEILEKQDTKVIERQITRRLSEKLLERKNTKAIERQQINKLGENALERKNTRSLERKLTKISENPTERKSSRKLSVIEKKLSIINEKLEKKATKSSQEPVTTKCVVKLLKLRNPSGDDMPDFRGEYCDISYKWTEELKKETAFDLKKPGTLFLTFEEYLQFFQWTFICKYMPNYVYNYAIFKFSIEKEKSVSDNPLTKSNVDQALHKVSFELNLNSAREGNISKDMDSEPNRFLLRSSSNNMAQSYNPHLNTLTSQKSIRINLNDLSTSKPILKGFPATKSEQSSIDSRSSADLDEDDSINWGNERRCFLRVYDTYDYSTLDHLVFASFDVKSQSRVYLTLHQPQIRFHSRSEEYRLLLAFVILVQYDATENRYTYVASDIGETEKLYLDFVLMPGEYHIYAKNYWTYPHDTQLVVSTYSQESLVLYQYPKSLIPSNWIQVILIGLAKNNTHREFLIDSNDEPTTSFSSYVPCNEENFTGFGIFYYENNSTDDYIEVILEISKSLGISILNADTPVDNEKEMVFRFFIPPKKFKCLIYQVTSLPWHCEVDWKHHCWFDLPDQIIVSRYLGKETTKKFEVAQGLKLYEIYYDRGYILMIDNLTENEYKWTFCFTKLMPLKLEKANENEAFEILSKPKLPYLIGVRSEGRKVDPSERPIYEYQFEEIASQ